MIVVSSEVARGVIVARMDDGRANALSFVMIEQLAGAVDAACDAGSPLVLAGREGRFSAGFDLEVMKNGTREEAARLFAAGGDLYRSMLEAPIPIVAACTGHALAGGALLLLSADLRLGQDGPWKIGLNEVRIGLSLPKFAVALARARLSPRHLVRSTYLAETGTPQEAAEAGFLDRVVSGSPVEAAIEAAIGLVESAGHAFSVSKRRVLKPLLDELDVSGPPAQSSHESS
jgi:enoyl-CoA hydratase